jgi:uncharacterized protein (UPF0332 family)
MDGSDYIRLAGKLAASPSADEASYRTAISRAYYGAFHLARDFLVDLGFIPMGNANVHAFVRRYLHASNSPDAVTAADDLGDLQTLRNLADYRLDDSRVGSQKQAKWSVERATQVASALANCRDSNAYAAMRQAILEYEQKLRPR